MEAVRIQLTLAEIAAGLAGCAAGIAAPYMILRHKRQKRLQRSERPPQEEKILRPAGYHAMSMVDDLVEKVQEWTLQAAASGLVLGMTAGVCALLLWWLAIGKVTLKQLWAAPKSDVLISLALVGLIALLFAIRSLQRMWKGLDDVRNWRFGLRGEQAVAEKLLDRALAAAGYVVFHDLPAERHGKKWNIDHIVAGPAGIFVLETKARPQRTPKWDQKRDEVFFDGKRLTFPWCYDDEAADQVQGNVNWLRGYLDVFAPPDLVIQPVVVVPGWKVRPLGNYPVKVMNTDFLVPKYLLTLKPLYTLEQLKTVIKRIDDACRTLEF